VYAFANNAPGDDLAFLPGLPSVKIGALPAKINFDTAVLLECSDKTRGGELGSVFANVPSIINIDHHRTSERYGTLNYIEPKASSTAEIICRLFELMKIKFTPKEATCLYTGLTTDTFRFLHSNTTAEALRAGSELLGAGADIKTINRVLYFTRSYAETKLNGRALEKMKIIHRGTLSVIVLTREDFKMFHADPVHTQGIVSQPVMIPGVEVSALVKEEKDKVSVNLRSSGKVDVSKIAESFGGGGHARAAGFKRTGVEAGIVAQQLIARCRKEIDETKS
jgi:phosphoesterase RecJ-like protein